MSKWLFFALFISIACLELSSQTIIKGQVISAADNEPISGVAIYLSGTSIGRVSGLDGSFEIEYPENINAPLIFRMLGYEKITVIDPFNANLSLVKLVEKPDELETVYIANDDWSREKKLKFFKQFFLGRTDAAKECKILNLDQVRLRYNPITNLLTAASKEPIAVQNETLGYDIQVDLNDFEILFETIDLSKVEIPVGFNVNRHHPLSSYMEGSMFFQEMKNKRPSMKRRARNRRRLYKISEMRFYRSMIAENLKKDGYQLLHKRKVVDIAKNIRVRSTGDTYEIAFRHPEYILMDKFNNQTTIFLMDKQKIKVDSYGNCLTPREITLGGFLAKLHLSGMLPLDYSPDN